MSERDELKPCPFCGGKADFERMGTSRQSCIVECESCGVRHESSDEYGRSGQSWNERQPTRAPQAVPALTHEQFMGFRDAVDDLECELQTRYQGYPEDDRRRVRDFAVVKCARALLRDAAPQPSPEKCFRCGHAAHHGSCVNVAPRSED